MANNGFSVNLLPKFYQTDANKKFLQSTIDQLYQPGTLTKTSGYVGRKNAKASTGKDIYVAAADQTRQNYQLEPGLTITDTLGNVKFFKDYIDYINQINVFGGNVSNHARLNKQEFYSWDPHIDWDKFVNFQNYYWLPNGPETINIYGNTQAITSTYTVSVQNEGSNNQYIFTPDGLTPNPVLKLYRGQTYVFNIDSPGNPFSIKTVRTADTLNRYVNLNSVSAYGVTSGTITFTVPPNSPKILYYQSENDINLGGTIEVYSAVSDTSINVAAEILGKSSYTLSNGTSLSNGMKVSFLGTVTPSTYSTGEFYVEGVGSAIRLIPASSLEIINSFTTNTAIPFESDPFDTDPFDISEGYVGNPDYITINRASRDKNPWTRYNRWFHQDVINASSTYNGTTPSLDQSKRATRPIIEFQPDLKLFNMGTIGIQDVDLIDSFTTDAFLMIEGTAGYNIDGVNLVPGLYVIFTADPDPLVQNKIFQVQTVNVLHLASGITQLHLVPVATPTLNQVVLVRQGLSSQGDMYWFDGTKWNKGQTKTSINQPPMFDIVDSNGISFGNLSTYPGSSFTGTSVFSYPGSLPNNTVVGSNDSVLGFPLTYQNVNNIGDIVFNFNLVTDTFQWKMSSIVETVNIDTGFLSSLNYAGSTIYLNGWQVCTATTVQAAIRIYDNTGLTNNFNIDIFDNINNLVDLVVKVYVNGTRLSNNAWSLVKGTQYYQVVFPSNIQSTDILTIKAYASQPINSNGFYEVPVSLQSNPLNDVMNTFTLGEVIDHVNSMVDNVTTFSGNFPGDSNLRDLGNVTQYGVKFLQHSGPLSLPIYHLTSESNNIIKALQQSRDDYSNFKRLFLTTASNLGMDGNPIALVDKIMEKINYSKPQVAPYYLSDMVPYGPATVTNLTVVDHRVKAYPLTNVFTLNTLSNKAVGVYHNNVQLTHGQDFTFSATGYIIIDPSVSLVNGDVITTYEYLTTDGSFVPATPTKLGMWPAFAPKIYLDTTLVNPVMVIQGHDGSIIAAYNDYRDNLILELEKRIFNNIKVKYDPTIFDIKTIIPSHVRVTDYSLSEFNSALSPNFYNWVGLVGKDLTTPLSYNRGNSFTYNYSLNTSPDGVALPGYWRGVYQFLLDTDRPHLCPWEMLGFSLQPSWWVAAYGPAPYTSDNVPMWTDIANGAIRQPGVPVVVDATRVRPFLLQNLPVDSMGNLLSPQASGLATGTYQPSINNNFVFGDISPVENAWRRSSYYAFSVISTAILLKPALCFGTLIDRSRVVRNIAGQLIYSDTGLRIRPKDIVLPSVYSSSTRVQTAGLVNYIVDLIFNYIFSNDVAAYSDYQLDLQNINIQLSYRVGAFTNQDQFNLLLESKTPNSTGNVFIPNQNYKVFLNKSSPVKKLIYSGVIITRVSTGFEVKGYSKTQPYFNYYQYNNSGPEINVGGISESYVTWTPNQTYVSGQVVVYNGAYYRSKATFTSGNSFDFTSFAALPSLPMQGGTTAILRTSWNRATFNTLPYGTLLSTTQSVVDFLLGYGEYLKDQGFIFDNYNTTYNAVSNWETSAQEFLFWTTQNWSTGQNKWSDWAPNQPYGYGSIVRYNGDYYSALYNLQPVGSFDLTKWSLLAGISNVGASVISLSPGANEVNFSTTLSVVDSITNPFNTYEIFKVDGTPFEISNLDSYRQGNLVKYTPRNEDGIYSASFYLVQNEHVIIIDNNSIFNDVIYNPPSGYRRERLKVSGYVTVNWYGGLDIPGFLFDSATVNAWQPWQDYKTGDIVSYQSYYYSADAFIPGAATFSNTNWSKLPSKPVSQILPNWTNIATQFVDFYGTDVDSFNTAQQTMAQHLIGYQKRQYLENIIQDDVSEFKFYQGMIREKGTQNVLNKLFNVLSSDQEESLTFYEEWAVRVGRYGATNAFQDIEFVLDQNNFLNNPQGTVLVNSIDSTINPFIIQQTPNQIYVSPTGYNSQPFPVLASTNQYLRDAGYVNISDVFVGIKNLSDLISQPVSRITVGVSYKIISVGTTDFTTAGAVSNTIGSTFVATAALTGTGTVQLDIEQINEGSYIWCVFDGPTSWNVYRFTDVQIRVTNVFYSANILTITTQNPVTLSVGSYVGLSQVTSVSGFYQISSVNANSFTVVANGLTVPNPFTNSQTLVVYAMISQRIANIDNLASSLPSNLQAGNLVWTDTTSLGTWANWIFNPVYSQIVLLPTTPSNSINFGSYVSVSKQGNIAGTLIGNNQVGTYDRISNGVSWTQRQVIQPPFNSVGVSSSLTPVSVIAFSPDGTWMATGSPSASNTSSSFKGTYNASVAYSANDIVFYNGLYFQALIATIAGQTPSQLNVFWNQVFYVPVSSGSYNTGVSGNGIVSLYKKDSNDVYQLVNSILSPSLSTPTSENFGSSLVFDSSNLYVSAVANNSNTGTVYKLSYLTTVQLTKIYDPVNSAGIYLKLTSTDGIYSGMSINGFDSLGNSAFQKGQTVSYVITRALFSLYVDPTTGKTSSSSITNTLNGSINISSILQGQPVTLFQTIGGTTFNIPNLTVYTTGLTSTNVIVTTQTLTGGGTIGTSSFTVATNSSIAVGQLVVGLGAPTGSFVGSITPISGGLTVVLVDFTGAVQNFIANGSGVYQFFNTVTYGYVDMQAPKGFSSSTYTLPVTAIQFNNDPTLIFNVYQLQSTNAILLSSAPDLSPAPAGNITFSSSGWQYAGTVGTGLATNNYYGSQLALSADGSTLVVSAAGGAVGQVYIYRSGTLIQTLTGLDNSFGQGITVSDSGNYIAISDDLQSTTLISQQGTVGIYSYNSTNNNYSLYQSIADHQPEVNGEFGSKISFMNNYQTLVVYSQNGSSVTNTTFDTYKSSLKNSNSLYGTPYVTDPTSKKTTGATTFDKKSTVFTTVQIASGRVDVYDNYNTQWVYGESLANVLSSTSGYGQGFAVGSNSIFVGIPYTPLNNLIGVGQVNLYTKLPNTQSWSIYRSQQQIVDVSKIKKIFLYNKLTEKLLTYFDVIDPIQGKIAGPAQEEINYQTFYDPATYSYTDGTVQVTVNSNGFWNTNQLGKVWWNLSTSKFLNPYFSDPSYRNNTWNTLAPGASVDVYEWVSSSLKPSQWDAQSVTAAGQSAGISGNTVYGDSAYSVTQTYNSLTKSFKSTYYFWVANKTTVPNITGRKISVQAVASLIANPLGQAYSYLALTGPNSFSLANVSQYLNSNNVVLAVEYWTVNSINRNIHSQWKLISTDDIVDLPTNIQQKWIDSLCGADAAGRPVPDYNLPVKLQYGIENRPRQSMFVNRVEALKEFIEGLNALLLETQVTGNYDLTQLNSYQLPPTYTYVNNVLTVPNGEFDQLINTDAQIPYTNINLFVRPSLTPIIINGKITGITILNPGKGYLQAPYITITGSGTGAVVESVIDSLGRIISATVISSGKGYNSSTTATIRDYSVLVLSDAVANGAWSVYSFNPTYYNISTKSITGQWTLAYTKGYDVRDYWSYVDWYANGYSQFTAPDYAVATFVDLNFINTRIGDIVKILTVNTGGWMLLEKYANSISADWTQSYKVIGLQNGTIQFSANLYSTNTSAVGYDSTIFDNTAFDVKAATELRIILQTLQHKILINSLYSNYLDLFFRSVKYAHSEQPYIDWIFKTSFVRATHNVGPLSQPVYYPVDNLSNFQDYIAEVKPYRTKIREYISQYVGVGTPSGADVAETPLTDFDLPPVVQNNSISIINASVNNGIIVADQASIQTYPWKFWLTNVGFIVVNLVIVSGGSGYITQPTITFTSNSGSGATAQAYFTNGVINRVILTNSGSGYLSVPTVTVTGGLGSGGIPARIVAIIGQSLVRDIRTELKFDRITQKQYITNLNWTDTFVGTGSKLVFNLTWGPDVRIGKTTVTIFDKLYNSTTSVLRENYTVSIVSSKSSGFTQYSGQITFLTAPTPSQTITVSYTKDSSLLNAIDRINFYYNPIAGMPGKDPTQLMTGVDYGGAIVGNLGFSGNGGWSNLPYGSDKWDSYDTTYTDYTVAEPVAITVQTPLLYNWTMPYVAPAGTQINVYWQKYVPLAVSANGTQTVFPFNYNVTPTVNLSRTTTTSNLMSVTTTTVTQGTTIYPISTTTLVVLQAVSGNNGQSAIVFSTTAANVAVGQYVSGTGIPYGAQVASVNGSTVTINANLSTTASGSYSFFVLGTTLTLTSTTGIIIGLGVVGTGFTTQSITKIINSTTVLLNLPPNTLPTVGETVNFVSNVAGSSIVTVPYDSVTFYGYASGTSLFVTTIPNIPIAIGTIITGGTGFTAGTVITAQVNVNTNGIGQYTISVSTTSGNSTAPISITASTTLLNIGDVITSTQTGYTSTFGYNTSILGYNIVNAANNYTLVNLTLSQITYGNLPSGVSIIATRSLNSANVQIGSSSATFSVAPATGMTVNINGYMSPVKIDAPDFNVGTGKSATNPNAVMASITATGSNGNVSIPTTSGILPNANDKFIFRISTSDGSISALGQDSNITGGTTAATSGIYSTATGLNADDIILDGDGLITANTSPAPEEVVPGQVVDALALKVFDRNPSGSANIKVDNFVTNGTQTEFVMSIAPTSATGVIVKLGSSIKTYNVDYTVSLRNRAITFNSAPAANQILTIFTTSYSGQNVLDVNYFIGDGSTTQFITQAPWESTLSAGIFVNGSPVTYSLFKTTPSYVLVNVVGISFASPPPFESIISYIIVNSPTPTFAITSTETVATNGSTTYTLQNLYGNSLPNESYMIVRANNTILPGPVNSYFTLTANQTAYTIDPNKITPFGITSSSVSATANGLPLQQGRDYSVDLSGVTVNITNSVLNTYLGKTLVVSVLLPTGYSYNSVTKQITFAQTYQVSDTVQVTSSYQHDSIDLQRTSITVNSTSSLTANTPIYYKVSALQGGLIVLERSVLNENYVWVTKNSVLLVPGIDYKLNDDHITVQLAVLPSLSDKIEVITYGSNVLNVKISYMQFKDMMNNTTYTRLNANKQTTLAQPLHWNDTTITLTNGSNFQVPNPSLNLPGTIEIGGERIQYFAKNGDVLSQLRRAVMGTGIVQLSLAGAYVQDISSSETIPYKDTVSSTTISYSTNSNLAVQLFPYDTFYGYISDGLADGLSGNVLTVTSGSFFKTSMTPGFVITNQTYPLPGGTKIVSQTSGTTGGIGVYTINYTGTVGSTTSPVLFTVTAGYVPVLGSSSDATGIVSWFTNNGYTYTGAYSSSSSYVVNSIVIYNNAYYYNTVSIPALGSRILGTNYSPANSTYWTAYTTTIPVGYGQCNTVEVFVGGYSDNGSWAANTYYAVNTIVDVGSYTYRCITAHTSSSTFTLDSTNWVFFIGNIRLKKLPYKVHNVNISPYSPAGDVAFDADWSVDGYRPVVRLTNALANGTQVTAVRRTGMSWDGTTNILYDNSQIGSFIKAVPGIWYYSYKLNSVSTIPLNLVPTMDSTSVTMDNVNITMDRG